MSPSTDSSEPAEAVKTAAKQKKDRQARKYGFACANCRRRKTRCDGRIPSCDRCTSNNEVCHYNKTPSVTYSILLQNQVKAAESLMNELRAASDVERLRILDDHFSNDKTLKVRRVSSTDGGHLEGSPSSEISVEDELTELLHETSVDEDGRICFYGSTSNLHLEPDQAAFIRQHAEEGLSIACAEDTGTISWQQAPDKPHTESLSSLSPSTTTATVSVDHIASVIDNHITLELFHELMEIYWCWPHHLHLVLCRKLFMRDLVSSGPYVTPFLLNATLSQAARFLDRPEAGQISQYLGRRALELLPLDLDKGSSIPTIQGLLIFSARECACGRTSQGWLYSGMAFRMMRDMGIHIHPQKLSHLAGQFSPEELALRQQIFWSCYTWDKTMSLCLGRTPSVHEPMPLPTLDKFIDGEEAENEPWRPIFATASAVEVGLDQKANTHSRFAAYCHLCTIIDNVLETLYSKPHAQQHHLQGFLDRTMQALDSWAEQLPSHLYIRGDTRAVTCPPLHVLLLNLVYHATVILLCRPYRSTQVHAQQRATAAAEMIDLLFMLHVRRFGFRVISYLESYTLFVASTINVLDLKEGINEEGARARLALTFEVFRNARSTPSNMRCADIIEQLLRKSKVNARTTRGSTAENKATPASSISTMHASSDTQRTPLPQMAFPKPSLDLNNSEAFGFVNIQNAGNFPTFDQQQQMPETPAMEHTMPLQMSSSSIETPLRWLPENFGDDHAWMMMGMDFGNLNPDTSFLGDGLSAATPTEQMENSNDFSRSRKNTFAI